MTCNRWLFYFLLLLLLFSGCFSGKSPLRGKVAFSDDQSPLQTGMILFVAEKDGFIGTAEIKPDGTYRASSTGVADGLPPGKYKVRFNGAMIQTGGTDVLPIMESLIDDRFRNTATSGLEVEIPRTKVFDIQVDRYVSTNNLSNP